MEFSSPPRIEDFDDIPCESFAYSSGGRRCRTIYQTPAILWEEHCMFGSLNDMLAPWTYTVFPPKLPDTLPEGADQMGFEDGSYYSYNWVSFKEENALQAFIYACSFQPATT